MGVALRRHETGEIIRHNAFSSSIYNYTYAGYVTCMPKEVQLFPLEKMVDDELKSIEAIYCRPGEISVFSDGDGSRQVKVRFIESALAPYSQPLKLEICFLLSNEYPTKAPTISVFSDEMCRDAVSHLRALLCTSASQKLDQPMLMDLISLASDEFQNCAQRANYKVDFQSADYGGKKEVSKSLEENGNSTDHLVLLHLDHMRSKVHYVKQIKKWVAELSLKGCLIFCQRLILIVLQGPHSVIQEYIIRQRTGNVDVDSRGHPCKERMLSVKCDVAMAQSYVRFTNFEVVELDAAQSLEQFFKKFHLQDLFFEHIKTLKYFPGK